VMENIQEVLDFAIKREIEALEFYAQLADLVDNPEMKKTFLQFSAEEAGHRVKLEAVKAGKLHLNPKNRIQTLAIVENLVIREKTDPGNMSYQDALILAMDRERSSFKMYSDLAEIVEEQEVKDIFLALAQEEAKHKLRFEIEYDDIILQDN